MLGVTDSVDSSIAHLPEMQLVPIPRLAFDIVGLAESLDEESIGFPHANGSSSMIVEPSGAFSTALCTAATLTSLGTFNKNA
jgi:hypothetical protein